MNPHLSKLVIPAMFHTASIWLTLALAVQRYIYVCHAPVARTWYVHWEYSAIPSSYQNEVDLCRAGSK
ncbi:hypothetical protein MSG28_015663 [Choristoneura fumiferana]|uniref:Uncharacterized protein n=1 Tax=Choristoneura fumiferana TaxID=7141 RepID=A0ACC0KBV5_CHOFU|nr:hypothetical protein MSG28_015663 [Choristoneura fumiferana]